MITYKEIETWDDLLRALQKASAEQLTQPVQICEGHPCDDYVHELTQGICMGTIDELEIKYARSVNDNRRHGEHLVIFTDGNPHGEDGAIAYEGMGKKTPIYSKDHDDSQDWTGPAQKLVDAEERKKGHGTLGPVLVNRLRSMDADSIAKGIHKKNGEMGDQ